MHTHVSARGQGIGRSILEHLVDLARARGLGWLGLETGTMAAFAAARRLYASVGFSPCPPFGAYANDAFSVCMSMDLGAP